MRHAIGLAAQGQGFVEPNPMVGAVLVDSDLRLVADGWHQECGQAHAEVNAINAAETDLADATLFTLEPCNHAGKTPPCCDAILSANIRQVVIGSPDPAPHTNGAGIRRLREAGLTVEVGLLQSETDDLIAPFAKRISTGKPWVIGKWAMTLDGKIAASSGHSQWISSKESRAIVHSIRGRVDAILVGRGTCDADNPALTARPPGSRIATRVILDSDCSLATDSELARTASNFPTLLICDTASEPTCAGKLEELGVEVVRSNPRDIDAVLTELGSRGCTNVLIEGGAGVLGSFFDASHVDEVHAFIAPKLVGGSNAPGPIGGVGLSQIPARLSLGDNMCVQSVGPDVYISGRITR